MLASKESFVTLLVKGKNAKQRFKNEDGKHCVQRVPPTERGGRIHTSIVSVAVLPLVEQTAYKLNNDDIEIQITKGSGPGGQHKNVTSSAVRVVHKPTKLSAFVDGRCQHQNKKKALKVLSARVSDYYEKERRCKHNQNRLSQLSNRGRGEKVRTYNFDKKRVVDHRLGTKTNQIEAVMKGNLDLIF